MKRKIRIKAGSIAVLAELYNTENADAIWQAFPFSSNIHTWGEEIYFSIPVKIELEEGQEVVGFGDLGFWPPGSAFCIFFGPTPISGEGEIRPASPVNIFGRLIDDSKIFRKLKEGEGIDVEKVPL